jgi:hypothetical protein
VYGMSVSYDGITKHLTHFHNESVTRGLSNVKTGKSDSLVARSP